MATQYKKINDYNSIHPSLIADRQYHSSIIHSSFTKNN